jgi:hypothetical protein
MRNAVLLDPVRLVAKDRGDGAKQVREGRAAEAGGRRKIGAAPYGLRVRCQDHGQRPSARLSEGVQRRHVDLVDVGSLLPIHLDVHVELVHDRGDRGIFEALMRHHMTPMTGGITDGQEDRTAEATRFRERRVAPGPPMHGVVPMLKEVRACLSRQKIGGRQQRRPCVLGHGAIPCARFPHHRAAAGQVPVPLPCLRVGS